MEYFESFETVKQKLIIAGISEIQEHGVADFSLRRVASRCNVSCAAPYKHFKSKEDFISEIVLYIHSKWIMLQNQVEEVFMGDIKKQLTETCVAYIKFWIANPNFRTILMLNTDTLQDDRISSMTKITKSTKELIKKCCEKYGVSKSEYAKKEYVIMSLIYGATLLIDSGEIANGEETINMIRECIEREF